MTILKLVTVVTAMSVVTIIAKKLNSNKRYKKILTSLILITVFTDLLVVIVV